MSPSRHELPIDAVLEGVLTSLRRTPRLVLEAPPGAGKTTRIPMALLGGLTPGLEVRVAEPRRVAARLAAERVSQELGQVVGGTVGYSVRFEEKRSSRTRVRYVTEGLLLRQLLTDPNLEGVGAVVLDEFHERSLSADALLAQLYQLQLERRPELWLVVMSATLEGERVARHLGDCPRIRSEGRMFPVTIEHLARPDEHPLAVQVKSAVRGALARISGSVLVFLPGAREIRLAEAALQDLALAADVAVLPLHGELPLSQQARVLEPSSQRRVVLSTNIAEASVTIEGVTAVVDSGLVRRAEHNAHTQVPELKLVKVSQASAVQRAGRAGRTQPGLVLRLYTKADFEHRPPQSVPEIHRADLAEILLSLAAAGVRAESLPWLDPPEEKAHKAANLLLARLGALDPQGNPTELANELARIPVHPRLARVVVEGRRNGVGRAACLLSALLSERDIRLEARAFGDGVGKSSAESGPSDLLELRDRFEEARERRFEAAALRYLELDARSVQAVQRLEEQLLRAMSPGRSSLPPGQQEDEVLRRCLLAGFADRVARRRAPGKRELLLRSGQTAQLAESSVVTSAPWLLALDLEERREPGRTGLLVRLASAVEESWLLEDCYAELEMKDELAFDSTRGVVERLGRIKLGSLVLEETRSLARPDEASSELLFANASGNDRLRGQVQSAVSELAARLALLSGSAPDGAPTHNTEGLEARVLREACRDAVRISELESLDFAALALGTLEPEVRAALERNAPLHVLLPGKRRLRVHYEADKPPWVESRMQDFFGSRSGPSLCGGQVQLTLHLLAPNGRAVQVTRDLAGFWQQHYPSLRRQLMRRYPRHAWPENPLEATPPTPKGPR